MNRYTFLLFVSIFFAFVGCDKETTEPTQSTDTAVVQDTTVQDTTVQDTTDAPITQHDTRYYWGCLPRYGEGHDWSQLYDPQTRGPTQQVLASADSAEVRYVYFSHLDENLAGTTDKLLCNCFAILLDGIPKKNLHKIRGEGELYRLGITSTEDSLRLADFGFKIVKSINKREH